MLRHEVIISCKKEYPYIIERIQKYLNSFNWKRLVTENEIRQAYEDMPELREEGIFQEELEKAGKDIIYRFHTNKTLVNYSFQRLSDIFYEFIIQLQWDDTERDYRGITCFKRR